MFCKKCGSRIADNETVCTKCGNLEESVLPEIKKSEKQKIKVNLKKQVGIAMISLTVILLVVGIVIGITQGAAIANAMRQAKMEPEEYYKYIEKQEIEKVIAGAVALYNDTKEGMNIIDKSIYTAVRFKLDEDMQSLLDELNGENLLWLNQMKFMVGGNITNNMYSATLTIEKEDETLFQGSLDVDLNDEKAYLQIPQLFVNAMGMETDLLFRMLLDEDTDRVREFLSAVSDLHTKIPDKEMARKILRKYGDIIIGGVSDVEKTEDTLMAGGISAEYTLLTAVIDEDGIQGIAENVLETMIEDPELKEIILDVISVQEDIDGEEICEVLEQALEGILKEINEQRPENKLKIKLWVDGEGIVRGRSIERTGNDDTFKISYALPQNGKKTGVSIVINFNGKKYKLDGSMEQRSGRWNGTLDFKLDGSKIASVELQNVVMEYGKEFSGVIQIEPSKIIRRKWEEDISFDFGNIGLKFDFSFTTDQKMLVVSLQRNEQTLGEISTEMETAGGKEINFPEQSKTVFADDSIDIAIFIAAAEEKDFMEKLWRAQLPTSMLDDINDIFGRTRYYMADKYFMAGKYEEALREFEVAGDYWDARMRSEECRYNYAWEKIAEKEYEEAEKVLDGANGYAYVEEIKQLRQYLDGLKAFENEKYHEAKELLEPISGQYNVAEELWECDYRIALYYMSKEKYSKAKEILETLSAMHDVSESLTECNYQIAVEYMEAGTDEKAKAIFMTLGDYKESQSKLEIILAREPKWKIGDAVIFGTYEQDNNVNNGKEAIEWVVLEVKDGKVLLVSKYALDFKRYHEEWENVTWETCTLRAWLNQEFLSEAFSETEQTCIVKTSLKNPNNSYWGTSSGNSTKDKIFLLSEEEVTQYFNSNSARKVQLTEYAKAQGGRYSKSASTYGYGSWWLRTAGISNDFVMVVDSDGSISESGDSVACYGDIDEYGNKEGGANSVVRPALWLKQE